MTIIPVPFDNPSTCPQCGASPLSVTVTDPVTEDSEASCTDCGYDLGRFGSYKAKVLEDAKGPALDAAKAQATAMLKSFRFGK